MESQEVIARPHFDKADLAWLTDIRSRRAGSRGAPYFTLVFPGVDLEPKAFAAEVRARVEGISPIRFRLRSALVVPEQLVGRFHVFLIPDEGFGAILKLHDALHAGAIKAALRKDSPYLPHITVATTSDYNTARNLAISLNHGDIDIRGHIEALQVEHRIGEVIKLVAEIPLPKAGWFG
ncbi:2'-5' RNA ligase [Caulobacter ginsengisoli]|uniref:2'-5' RNA ligase n=1 Tax=Caulobacter ginsengisoli TaxID=400775 RepID=A0ABU0IR55_9CAUL|nr:2'-5' RNA ligase family protein [Caulobacter ginsengisoli]MDQ0464498.1 2'-5' RNA ligase [Caulobacter ginsengisoli]